MVAAYSDGNAPAAASWAISRLATPISRSCSVSVWNCSSVAA
jgi:hypothetical protein